MAGYGYGDGYTGMGTGWVYRVGNTGPWTHPARCSRRTPEAPAKRAPEPCRGGVGGCGVRTYRGRRGRLLYPPLRGPVGLQPPWYRTRLIPALQPIGATFDLIFSNVSQNRRVSSKSVHEACHSPCFKNEAQKSPLDFLRFLYSLAFSHKELMGCF